MLEGDLTDFTLPDVLRLLAFTSKTGRLTLDEGSSRGRVELVEGRIRDASADARRLPLARRVLGAGLVEGPDLLEALAGREGLPTDLELARSLVETGRADAGPLAELVREQTVDAVFDLLRWTSGSFRFVAASGTSDTAAGGPVALAVAVDELLEEATRRLEQWSSLVHRTGDLGAVVTIARPERGPGDATEVALPPDGWGLLALVDGRRTVADLVDVFGQGEYHTRRTLGALLDERIVTVGAAEETAPLQRLLRDQAALAERERELGGTPPAAPAPAAVPTPVPQPEPVPQSEPVPELEPAPQPEPAPERTATPEPALDAAPVPDPDPVPVDEDVRQLRTTVRSERLRTDPTVDEDLVTRLIEGVEGL